MAVIKEFGHQYPCREVGELILPDDELAEMYDGDICEAELESDRDITFLNVSEAFKGILKMKEDYPGFVLHYMRFETRKVVIQFSAAPYQGTPISGSGISSSIAFGLTWGAVLMILAIASIIAGLIAAVLAMVRGWVFHKPLPTGTAAVTARDRVTNLPLADVEITVSGENQVTGPNGEAAVFEKLLEGNHTFIGAVIPGYDPPTPVSAYITADHTIDVLIPYNPEGVAPPTQGWLNIDTDPVKGIIYLDGIELGEAPQPQYVSIGDHIVAFGEIEGYITPVQQVITVLGDPYLTPCIGYYTKPGSWWEKFLWYGLTATALITGGAVLLPRLIKSIKSSPQPRQLQNGRKP